MSAVFFIACSPVRQVSHAKGGTLLREKYTVLKRDESVKQGPYAQYYNGVKQMEGSYAANKRTGLWHFYGYDGRLNFDGYYTNGSPT